jgi:nitrile hydratase accessory protein
LSGPKFCVEPPAPLRARDGDPLFAEPWQAQAVALASAMVEQGRFTPARWSEALGAEIRRASAAGAPDDTATYYQCVLATLEQLAAENALTDPAELARRKAQWIRAYEHTPHGQPVELSAGDHH